MHYETKSGDFAINSCDYVYYHYIPKKVDKRLICFFNIHLSKPCG